MQVFLRSLSLPADAMLDYGVHNDEISSEGKLP